MPPRGREVTMSVPVLLYLREGPVRIGAELTYRRTDPLTVVMQFTGNYKEPCWLVGRPLLDAGLTCDAFNPAGQGDVQVWTSGDHKELRLLLSGVEGSAMVGLDRPRVVRFLQLCEVVVPVGSEDAWVSAQVEAFLEAALRST